MPEAKGPAKPRKVTNYEWLTHVDQMKRMETGLNRLLENSNLPQTGVNNVPVNPADNT